MSRRVGSYLVECQLAQGGMGIVYLARQPALERTVILKKLRTDIRDDPSLVERFEREAKAAARIHHQNVVCVYDCFRNRGDRYIVQEHVRGENLQALLERGGPFPPRIAAAIALGIARGLEEIHSRGIVHRDLKPANVLVSVEGEIKLADFGIALLGAETRLTRPGTALGSIPYMAPEQMMGEPGDPLCDLFSFGVVFYELLTARTPFPETDDGSTSTLLERIQRGAYTSPRRLTRGVPRALCRLIRRCLEARRRRRVDSARLVRLRLERWLGRPGAEVLRSEIVTHFWQLGLFKAEEGCTVARTARTPRPVRTHLLRTAALAALSLGVLAAVPSAGYLVWSPLAGAPEAAPQVFVPETPAPEMLAAEKLPSAPPVVAPAMVTVAADPWAEVRIDGGETFHTPRAVPVSLDAGPHEITFEHPSHGRVSQHVVLAPGEHRSLFHRFRPADAGEGAP
jgi:tRNA A-37 threonylcarbamoyl transferase component Bud32